MAGARHLQVRGVRASLVRKTETPCTLERSYKNAETLTRGHDHSCSAFVSVERQPNRTAIPCAIKQKFRECRSALAPTPQISDARRANMASFATRQRPPKPAPTTRGRSYPDSQGYALCAVAHMHYAQYATPAIEVAQAFAGAAREGQWIAAVWTNPKTLY